MAPLTDAEFSARFSVAATPMAKIKLAIQEDRFTVVERRDKKNLPDEFLEGILDLSDTHGVHAELRRSGGVGLPQIYEFTYTYRGMGRPVKVYFKGYFAKCEVLVTELVVQSLREDT